MFYKCYVRMHQRLYDIPVTPSDTINFQELLVEYELCSGISTKSLVTV